MTLECESESVYYRAGKVARPLVMSDGENIPDVVATWEIEMNARPWASIKYVSTEHSFDPSLSR